MSHGFFFLEVLDGRRCRRILGSPHHFVQEHRVVPTCANPNHPAPSFRAGDRQRWWVGRAALLQCCNTLAVLFRFGLASTVPEQVSDWLLYRILVCDPSISAFLNVAWRKRQDAVDAGSAELQKLGTLRRQRHLHFFVFFAGTLKIDRRDCDVGPRGARRFCVATRCFGITSDACAL